MLLYDDILPRELSWVVCWWNPLAVLTVCVSSQWLSGSVVAHFFFFFFWGCCCVSGWNKSFSDEVKTFLYCLETLWSEEDYPATSLLSLPLVFSSFSLFLHANTSWVLLVWNGWSSLWRTDEDKVFLQTDTALIYSVCEKLGGSYRFTQYCKKK